MRRSLLPFIFGLSAFGTLHAEDIDFIGDYVQYNDKTKIAYLSGNVEIRTIYGYFYTNKVTYNVETEEIFVDGQLNGVLATGQKIIAQYAELDSKTQQIIAKDLVALITDGVQATTTHVEASENYLYSENVLSSNCKVCSGSDVPVWQVRAQQIYEDLGAQKVYIRNGNLDIWGVPIIWVPYLRIPAPEAGRMDGFLPMELIVTDGDLTGVKAPYYIPIGEYTDITITPYITSTDIQLAEFQYRQNLQGLQLKTDGIYGLDDGTGANNRFALRTTGKMKFPNGVNGSFSYALRSDYEVYKDFDYSRPRYDNIEIHKFTNDYWFSTEWRKYLPPSLAASKVYDYPILTPQILSQSNRDIPGVGKLSATFGYLNMDNDHSADISRANADIKLNRIDVSEPGILYLSTIGLSAAIYDIDKDIIPENNGTATRVTPYAALDMKLPLQRQVGHTTHLITPRLMATWSKNYISGVENPNIDSHFAERDYVNLFTPNPYFGVDKFVDGMAVSLGGSYSVQGFGEGENFEIGLGSVWRDQPLLIDNKETYDKFDNFVGYLNYDFSRNWSIYSRWAFDQKFELSSIETQIKYLNPKSYFAMDWVRLAPEPDYGFENVRSEINLNGRYLLQPNWDLGYKVRYDTVLREAIDANISLTYGNECIEMQGRVIWDFAYGNQTETTSRYEFQIDLLGISKPRTNKWAKKQCTY